MKLTLAYDIEKDLYNYMNKRIPGYGRGELKIGSLVPELKKRATNLSEQKKEKFIFENLTKFERENSDYLDIQIKALQKIWQKVGFQYSERLEKYFGIKIDFKEATGYLTTYGIAPYHYREKWFYVSAMRNIAAQLTGIYHELMHIVFRTYFNDKLVARGLSREAILDITEALVALLDYEFRDLLITTMPNEKPSTYDLQDEVVKLWKKNKKFPEILERLIEMRSY